jgi:hypothetical protein
MKTKAAKLQLSTRIAVETQAKLDELLACYVHAGEARSIQEVVEAAVLRWCSTEQRRLDRNQGERRDGQG